MAIKKKSDFKTKKQADDYFIGKKFRVVKDTCSHRIKKGTIITITRINFGSPIYLYHDHNGSYVTPTCLEELALSKEDVEKNIKDLKKQIKALQTEIKGEESKIKFMQENKLDTYDEEEFKVYKTLEALEDPATSKVQKAKIIAALIKS